MDRVREIASSGLALRKARSLRVRLPLAALTIVSEAPGALTSFSEILRDELNVKQVRFEQLEEGSLESFGITKKLTVNARALGPRIGKQVQHVIKEAKAGNWEATAEGVSVDGMALEPAEYELQMEAADEASAIAFLSDGGFVIIDTQLTAELSAEGLARDTIRVIQDARKAAGLDVSDRIALVIGALDAADHEAIDFHSAMIASETLAAQSTVQSFANDLPEGTLETYRTELPAGKYANAGGLVIDITKIGTTNV
jgi:isoleucyl-tRNA synthetase